jgi:hypothetical protein
MPYVSCMYAPPDPLQAEPKPAGQQSITCIDDQGNTWWLTEDSQVGDWLEFQARGGTVEPYVAPEPPEPEQGATP